MVIRILKGNTVFGPLNYNFNKENNEVATVLGGENFPCGSTPDMAQALSFFQNLTNANHKIENPIFTASLNPAPEDIDRISDEDWYGMAKEYMDKMGYGAQPYLVFKHTDIDRTHIHIVSVRVRPDGSLVSDKFEQRRTSKIRREMEIEHSLTKAEDRRTRKEAGALVEKSIERMTTAQEKSLHDAKDKRRYIRKALRTADSFNCKNIKELNRVLSAYRVEAELVGEGTNRQGILFYALNENGERTAAAIKGSAVSKDFSSTKILQRMQENEAKGTDKAKTEETKKVVEKWLKESRELSELISVLKGEGIDTFIQKRKSGEITGISFVDRVNRTVTKGSELGKGYSYKAIGERLERNRSNFGNVNKISEEDFKEILSLCSKVYRKKRGDVKTYFFESQLIGRLQELRGEFFKAVDEDARFDKYTKVSKMRAVDTFLGLKRGNLQEIIEKENEYFEKTCKKFVPYALNLTAEERPTYLAALNLAYKEGRIYSLRDESVSIPVSNIVPGEFDVREKEEETIHTYPLSKNDRETLYKIIESGVGDMEFNEYKPYHPLLKMLATNDRKAFIRRQIACEAERTFSDTRMVSDCVMSLLGKGFIVVPVRTADGKSTYAVRDFNSTDTKEMVVVSEEVRQRLDRINYTSTLLKEIHDKVYNEKGFVRPEYRTIVKLSRANSIEDGIRRDKEMEKAFKYLEGYDKSLAYKMRERYARGENLSMVASELEGKTLRRKNKLN